MTSLNRSRSRQRPAATGAREREIELLAEHAPVRQLRQRVCRGEHGELSVRLLEGALDSLQVGDVRHCRADSDDPGETGDRVVADEVGLALGILDLDTQHRLPRLQHALGQRHEDVSVHRRQLAQSATFDLVTLVLTAKQGGLHPVEQPEAGRRVLEEGVECGLVGLRALQGSEQPVTHRTGHRCHGGKRARTEDPRLGRVVDGMHVADRDRPQSDSHQEVRKRVGTPEEERDVDDDPEVKRRVQLSGRLEEGQLGDDQHRREGDQPVDVPRQPLVRADEQQCEPKRGSRGEERWTVQVACCS